MRVLGGVGLAVAAGISLACGGSDALVGQSEDPVSAVGSPEPVDAADPTSQEPGAPPEAAAPPAGSKPGTRCGEGMVRVDGWAGEYPMPVVHVARSVELPAYTDPCALESTATCVLEPGVYHPWGSGEAFATVRPTRQYRATDSFRLGTESVKAGQEVVLVTYLAEGYCRYRVGDTATEAMCPDVGDIALEALDDVDVEANTTQWVQPGCGAWVLVDDALLAREGIGEGTIEGFGEVGP